MFRQRWAMVAGIATWCMMASGAAAQEAPAMAPDSTSATQDRQADSGGLVTSADLDLDTPDGDAAEIVVTGSRTARRDFTAESPITTVNKEFLQNTGPATVEQSLNALPQFQATQARRRVRPQ